jgi:hypothetical protein
MELGSLRANISKARLSMGGSSQLMVNTTPGKNDNLNDSPNRRKSPRLALQNDASSFRKQFEMLDRR